MPFIKIHTLRWREAELLLASRNPSCLENGTKKSKQRQTNAHFLLLKAYICGSSSFSESVVLYNSIEFSHRRVEIDKRDFTGLSTIDVCQERKIEVLSFWYIPGIAHNSWFFHQRTEWISKCYCLTFLLLKNLIT